MKKLFSFDVTLEELSNLLSHKYAKAQLVLEFLKNFWYVDQGGSDKSYLNKVRVGSIDVFIDNDGHLHLDFITRFSLKNYPKCLKWLEDLKHDK